MNENERIFERDFHALRIGYEIRAEIAAVKLHTLDHFERGLHRLRLFHGDHAIFANLVHCLGNDVADSCIAICRYGADLRNHVAFNVFLEALDLCDGALHSFVDAAFERHRIRAGGNGLHAFAEDSLREHGCCGCSVTGNVGSLRSYFANHLRAHIFQSVFEFDLFRDRHSVFGNCG